MGAMRGESHLQAGMRAAMGHLSDSSAPDDDEF
jgi:hypothetical protein